MNVVYNPYDRNELIDDFFSAVRDNSLNYVNTYQNSLDQGYTPDSSRQHTRLDTAFSMADTLTTLYRSKQEQKNIRRRVQAREDESYYRVPFDRYAYKEYSSSPFSGSTFQDGGFNYDKAYEDYYSGNAPERPEEENIFSFGHKEQDPSSFLMDEHKRRDNLLDELFGSEEPLNRQTTLPIAPLLNDLQMNGIGIGSVTDGQHNEGSRHYHGRAVDIPASKNGGKEGLRKLLPVLKQKYPNAKIIDEIDAPAGKVGTGNHIHIEI